MECSERQQMLGAKLYSRLSSVASKGAGYEQVTAKLTGMILEMPVKDVTTHPPYTKIEQKGIMTKA